MANHSFVRHYKLHNVQGKIDYISNPDRQEHLYAIYDTTVDDRFWDYLAGENRKAFKQSGSEGECIEAREFVIMLPLSFMDYDPDTLLRLFTERFRTEYGLECSSALHLNKAKSNYHIHLIYSERKPLKKTKIKIADRNRFYDETGKHRKTKKEILDENGNIRPGCTIIKKGEEYDCKFFGPKEDFVGTPVFLNEIKHMYTDLINACVRDEAERLEVFDRNGPYLATKKIGKNNPKAEIIIADNEVRKEWNRTVDEARVSGVPEEDIVAMKKEMISSEVKESIKECGNQPERLRAIIKKAIMSLIERIRSIKLPEKPTPQFDYASYNEMVRTYSVLKKIKADIAKIDKRIEHKYQKIDECKGIRYSRFKATLDKEIAQLLIEKENKQNELSREIRKAGYKNVSKFMSAYEKSCRLLETYQAEHPEEKKPKESVLKQLRQYQEEAKITNNKELEKHKKHEMEL